MLVFHILTTENVAPVFETSQALNSLVLINSQKCNISSVIK